LNEWANFPEDKIWKLAFRGSKDGFTPQKFHQCCDNKGSTFTIIKSQNNFIFGGYVPISWTSSNSYLTDQRTFIFTIKNPHNIPPTKYTYTNNGNAVYDHASYLSTFGGGHDFYVSGNTCSVAFPTSYSDTTGKGSATFFGTSSITISEMEVFIVKQ